MEQDHLVRRPRQRHRRLGADPHHDRVGPAAGHQGARPPADTGVAAEPPPLPRRARGRLRRRARRRDPARQLHRASASPTCWSRSPVPGTRSRWRGASWACTCWSRSRSRRCCATACRTAAWHAVHLLSYFLFATTTVHMLTAGTDVKALVASSAAVLLGVAVTFGSVALYLWRSTVASPVGPATRSGSPGPGRSRLTGRFASPGFGLPSAGNLLEQRAGAVTNRRPVRLLSRPPARPGGLGRSDPGRRRRVPS